LEREEKTERAKKTERAEKRETGPQPFGIPIYATILPSLPPEARWLKKESRS
jgi:hypothetical protein